jgi:phage baseplate assembly protein V
MTGSVFARALKPLRDRLVSLVARAVVRAVRQDGLEVLQLETSPGVLSGSVERFGHYGLASATLPGAEAIRVYVLGGSDHPVAIAVDDRRYRPGNLAAGDVTLYNQHGDRVHLKASRELAVTVDGATVTVKGSEIKLSVGAASITLTPSAIAIKAPAINLDP